MEIAFLTMIIIPRIYDRWIFPCGRNHLMELKRLSSFSRTQCHRSLNARTIKINARKEIENEANYIFKTHCDGNLGEEIAAFHVSRGGGKRTAPFVLRSLCGKQSGVRLQKMSKNLDELSSTFQMEKQ